jgi:hypothetical protein
VIIKGGRVEIPIPWRMFNETQRRPAQAFVEAKLSLAFDLGDVVPGESTASCRQANEITDRAI